MKSRNSSHPEAENLIKFDADATMLGENVHHEGSPILE